MGLLSATTVQAQNYNTKCLGISAGYMFDTENVQAGVFMHLPFAKNWRVVPSVNYTFSHHDLNEWEINGNIHYLIPFAGRFSVYPLSRFKVGGEMRYKTIKNSPIPEINSE